MNQDSELPLASLRVDGGMTANRLLLQLLADLLGIPVGGLASSLIPRPLSRGLGTRLIHVAAGREGGGGGGGGGGGVVWNQ